jgi:hypothetical protein
MDRMCNDHATFIFTCDSKPAVMLLSPQNFQAVAETAYSMRYNYFDAAQPCGLNTRSVEAG